MSAAAAESSARNDPIGLDPLASPVVAYLERLHARYASVEDGAVATYIPELGGEGASASGAQLRARTSCVRSTRPRRAPSRRLQSSISAWNGAKSGCSAPTAGAAWQRWCSASTSSCAGSRPLDDELALLRA